VTGYSSAGCDFDPGPGSDVQPNYGGTDAFLSIFEYAESYVCAYTWGGPNDNYGYGISDILAAIKDRAFVTGVFSGTVDFDPSAAGIDDHKSNGGTDSFLSILTPDLLYE